jgi:poly(A)-specific ribonuclease
MEVDQLRFRQQLLPLLTHISNAKFVTFDFEMSGISAKPRNAGSNDIGKRTLQQQYDEMKIVAETFQVLQVGICCVEEDLDRGGLAHAVTVTLSTC